ncbi:MAG: DUF4956 domain-containing protein [Verrucomicrobiales bacterium]|jgi:hypothetical protein|nr:DUF4956 domain-containing protein [Verrucomicrobiales bacterium]
MLDWLLQGDYGSAPTNWPAVLLALLLAFACGHVIAWVYMHTHSGLSYSKSFVNALVLMPMIVALVMQVLSNNLVTAFGMMAVFAIVRFRNILRDTLDTTYILISLVIGMAAGTQKYSSAILGCALGAGVMLYLWYTSFGSRHRYDLIVNLHWAKSPKEMGELSSVLIRHSAKAHLASQRTHEGYEGTDLSYRLLLRDPSRSEELITELRQTQGISRVTSMQAEEESEI